LVVGNEQEYKPVVIPKDKTNRHFFYSNRDDFTKMGVELNRNMCSIDLYVFGH